MFFQPAIHYPTRRSSAGAAVLPPRESSTMTGSPCLIHTRDGIDFYESLEAMRVTVEDAVAVSPTSRFGEVYAVSNRGQLATGMNSRGGITVSEGDFNPERIQLDGCLLDDPMPVVNTGDVLA